MPWWENSFEEEVIWSVIIAIPCLCTVTAALESAAVEDEKKVEIHLLKMWGLKKITKVSCKRFWGRRIQHPVQGSSRMLQWRRRRAPAGKSLKKGKVQSQFLLEKKSLPELINWCPHVSDILRMAMASIQVVLETPGAGMFPTGWWPQAWQLNQVCPPASGPRNAPVDQIVQH